MVPIDRTKWMDLDEVTQLRTVVEAWSITDLNYGRQQGVISWLLVDVALATGLRVAELASLEIKAIDLKRSLIRVKRVKKRSGGRTESLAIGQDLRDHLAEYIDWADQQSGPLFIGKRGPLTRQGLQRIWKRAVKRAGLPTELSIHSARHTMAVHLLKKTGNLRMVQKQLAHSSPTTTANLYADVSFEDMKNGVEGLYDQV